MKFVVTPLLLTCLFCMLGWAAIPPEVVLYLPLESIDEGDLSMYANKCTVEGKPKAVAGKIGQGVKFDGSSDCIVVPDSESLATITDQITMAAWVYPTALTSLADIICKLGSGGEQCPIHFELRPAKLRMCLREGPNKIVDFITTNAIEEREWTYLTEVYDGKEARIYFNGKEVASASGTGEIKPEKTVCCIGADVPDKRYFFGILDEVVIWRKL